MSLFGSLSSGLGGLVNKAYAIAKPLIGGVAKQYLGEGGGALVGKILPSTQAERAASRGESMVLSQILPSSGPMSSVASQGYMPDPGLMMAAQYQNPIQTQYPLINRPPEPAYYTEDEYQEYESPDDYECVC